MSGSASSEDASKTTLYAELVTALKQSSPPVQRPRPVSGTARGMLAGAQGREDDTLLFSFPSTGGAAPVARWAHAAAAVDSLLFTYGGVGQVVLDDLAVLDVDLMTWRALSPRAPSPRDRPGKLHAAAMAATGPIVWLFGGQQGRKFLRELFALDTDRMAWHLASPAGAPPPARAGHAMASVDGAGVFLFGGQGKKMFDDLHLLVSHHQPRRRGDDGLSASSAGSGGAAGASGGGGGGGSAAGSGSGASSGGGGGAPACEWVEIKPRGRGPSGRRGHTLTWDGHDSLVLFGGSTSSSTDNGLWVYSVSRREWAEVKARGTVPSPRTHHSAVLLQPDRVLVFGGCNAQGVFFQDAYTLDLATWTWSRPVALGALPAPRYHHSCTRAGRRVVIYGGVSPRQAFDGVVLVEPGSNFGGELSAVADELCRMSVSSAASDGGLNGVGGGNGAGGGSVHGSSLYGAASAARVPSAPPSLAGAPAAGDAAAAMAALEALMAGGGGAAAAAAAAPASPGPPPSLPRAPAPAPSTSTSGFAASGAPPSPPPAVPAPGGAPSAASNGGASSVTGASLLSGDLMKLQLRDLLVKRHLEDLHMTSARKAEELAAALEAERRGRAAAERELLQVRLVRDEAEEASRRERRRADEAEARAARAAAEAGAARAEAAAAGAARAAGEAQLAEANALLASVSRELGLLSSRHHRLRLEHAALQRARERERERVRAAGAAAAAGARAPAAAAAAPAGEEEEGGGDGSGGGGSGSGSCRSSSEGLGPAPGPADAAVAAAAAPGACAHARGGGAAAEGPCLLCAVQRYLAATQALLAGAGGAAAVAEPPPLALPVVGGENGGAGGAGSGAAQLLLELSQARAAAATAGAARAAAEADAASRRAAADAAAADAAELRAALARLSGDRLALAACGAAELREIEARIDAAGRVVRSLVVERTVAEMQRRSASDAALCTLCMERPKELVFGCGHQTCRACGEQLAQCAFCRADITAKIRLFES